MSNYIKNLKKKADQNILFMKAIKFIELQKEAKLIPLTQIHDRSLSWLGTGTSIYKVAGLNYFFMGPTILVVHYLSA